LEILKFFLVQLRNGRLFINVKLHALANTIKSTYTCTRRGNNNFGINSKIQDSNSIPWALIVCQVSCNSQSNQKFKLMERPIVYIGVAFFAGVNEYPN
jgi:hypothetical protein